MIAEAQGNLLFGYFLGIRDSSGSGSFGKKHLDPTSTKSKVGYYRPIQNLYAAPGAILKT